jgi:predicted dehydrogenase
MNDSNVPRIGLIGAGGIAGVHVEAYARMTDRITVTGVSDINIQAAAALAGKVDAKPYADYREMLASTALDAVDICLPHHLHAEAIIEAAHAGKHILCEKPMCMTLDEAALVRQAVNEAGVTLMCAHNQLFLPAVAEAKRVLDSGEIGQVYEVRTNDAFQSSMTGESAGWRAHAATNGGGELIDTGYHPSYLLLHLAGALPTAVTAMVANHRMSFLDTEDSANVLVRFDNGVIGNIATSWAYQPPADTERFTVLAAKGSIRGGAQWLSVETADGRSRTLRYPAVDTFAEEISHFAKCLDTGERPVHTELEGAIVLDLITSAYRSAHDGVVVSTHAQWMTPDTDERTLNAPKFARVQDHEAAPAEPTPKGLPE